MSGIRVNLVLFLVAIVIAVLAAFGVHGGSHPFHELDLLCLAAAVAWAAHIT